MVDCAYFGGRCQLVEGERSVVALFGYTIEYRTESDVVALRFMRFDLLNRVARATDVAMVEVVVVSVDVRITLVEMNAHKLIFRCQREVVVQYDSGIMGNVDLLQ